MSRSKSKMSNMNYATSYTTILGIPTMVISPIVTSNTTSTASEYTFNPYTVYSEEERRVYREKKKDFIKLKLQMEQTKVLFRQLKHSYDS